MGVATYGNEELAWCTAEVLELYLGAEARGAQDRHPGLPFVVAALRDHAGRGVPLLDLIQEGVLALVRMDDGADRAAAVRDALGKVVAERARTVVVPAEIVARERALGQAAERLTAELGRAPHEWELADGAGLSLAEVRAVRQAPRSLTGAGDELRLQLGDDALREAVASLPAEERSVLEVRYGVAGGRPHTLADASRVLSLPRAEILAIEEEALERLAIEREIRAAPAMG